MAAAVLRPAGYNVKTAPAGLVGDLLAAVARVRPDVLIVSALPPFTISHARSICRKARQRIKNLTIIVGLWNTNNDQIAASRERLGAGCSEYVVSSLPQMELQLKFLTENSSEETSPHTESLEEPVGVGQTVPVSKG